MENLAIFGITSIKSEDGSCNYFTNKNGKIEAINLDYIQEATIGEFTLTRTQPLLEEIENNEEK